MSVCRISQPVCGCYLLLLEVRGAEDVLYEIAIGTLLPECAWPLQVPPWPAGWNSAPAQALDPSSIHCTTQERWEVEEGAKHPSGNQAVVSGLLSVLGSASSEPLQASHPLQSFPEYVLGCDFPHQVPSAF